MKAQTKYIFPAIFLHEKSGYSVRFPDFEGCATSGASLDDAIDMARDALCLTLYDMEERGVNAPVPSNIETIEKTALGPGEFALLINCDTSAYRKGLND